MSEEQPNAKTQRISFFSKNPICCPVCSTEFYREELLTGRGRNIAGKLGVDLRRFWEANPKFGKVIPILYSILVCPNCYYSAYQSDFLTLMKDPVSSKLLLGLKDERLKTVENLLGKVDFAHERGVKEGIASYILAILCYDQLPVKMNPTFKNAMSALRLAWLCDEANSQFANENYDFLARIFYTKSAFLYERVEELELNGQEPMEEVRYFGPDSDVNYGYDGVLYLSVLLKYLFGSKSNPKMRLSALNKGRSTLSRIVGMGKSSKERPSNIIDKARDLYYLVAEECKNLETAVKTS